MRPEQQEKEHYGGVHPKRENIRYAGVHRNLLSSEVVGVVCYHDTIVQITALLSKSYIVTKTVPLNLRVTPEFKELLVRLAAAENRTITSYLEWLVKRDARRQRESRKNDPEE